MSLNPVQQVLYESAYHSCQASCLMTMASNELNAALKTLDCAGLVGDGATEAIDSTLSAMADLIGMVEMLTNAFGTTFEPEATGSEVKP